MINLKRLLLTCNICKNSYYTFKFSIPDNGFIGLERFLYCALNKR